MQWRIYLLGALVVLAGFALAYQFVEPAPPDRLVMATGAPDGAYAAYARRYRDILARNGIELELRQTAGSVENLDLLGERDTDIEVAFVQGGPDAVPDPAGLQSLGGVFLEPLWVLVRAEPMPSRLDQLAGMRLAVGGEGSGTRALATRLLAASGVHEGNATFIPATGPAAAAALAASEVDAVMLVRAASGGLVEQIANLPGVRLMSFAQAPAYAQLFRSIETVILHEGAIDLAMNRPDDDTLLPAAAANLVVREDLHPALKGLLLAAAREVHAPADLFSAPGRFPSPHGTVLPLAPEARRFYNNGPPLLQRWLPFWAANFVDRTAVMLIPLITLLLPLSRLLPPLVTWRIQSRVYRWYARLADIEAKVRVDDGQSLSEAQAELGRIDQEVSRIKVPMSYNYLVYRLRQHLDLVKGRVDDMQRSVSPSTAAAPRASNPSPPSPSSSPPVPREAMQRG
jgi:TRAP-type uncharacterized transport system substrate-binding protein